jgi:hypothetical protein
MMTEGFGFRVGWRFFGLMAVAIDEMMDLKSN